MSSGSSQEEKIPIEEVFVAPEVEESSEEPPMEEWSSLVLELPEENQKKILYEEGLYHPGSGEICAKYVTMSDSAVFRHPYYKYPAVLDPGIMKALMQPEEKIIYPSDGQELYMAVCKEMNQCPVMIFYRSLLEETINLKYYCVNPNGVRAMAMALKYNRIVKVLDLTDNFLNNDACYHLGNMLTENSSLRELNLSGCRIGPEGARRLFAGLSINRALRVLNLNRNQLGDMGGEHLAQALFAGVDVQQISLSYNNLGSKAASSLAEAFETRNKFTHIDLSWNNFFSPVGTYAMFCRLGENTALLELNLSYNAVSTPRIATGIKMIMKAPNLRYLNLSNNRLTGECITNLIGLLAKAKKLMTLDLSYNPLTPQDAVVVLTKMKLNTVKLQNLLMEGVLVNGEFLMLLNQIKNMKSKKSVQVIYGGVIGDFKPVGPDPRELVLQRADFLTKKQKKVQVDLALVAMQLLKDKHEIMVAKDFISAVQETGAPLDMNLLDEIVNVFPGPKTPKSKTIDMRLLVDYIHRKWPERQLPPTPPEPEPEPEPVPETKQGKEKGKGKK